MSEDELGLAGVATLTHPGLAEKNDDAHGISHFVRADGEAVILLAVADGISGAFEGGRASQMALAALTEAVERNLEHPRQGIEEGFREANKRIWEYVQTDPIRLGGMGTTLVCAILADGRVTIGNVGDSRLYLVDDQGAQQVTRDHEWRGGLIKSLGKEVAPKVDIFTPGDGEVSGDASFLFLCTDGVHGHAEAPWVTAREIHEALLRTSDLESACARVASAAVLAGSYDNITMVAWEGPDVRRCQPRLDPLPPIEGLVEAQRSAAAARVMETPAVEEQGGGSDPGGGSEVPGRASHRALLLATTAILALVLLAVAGWIIQTASRSVTPSPPHPKWAHQDRPRTSTATTTLALDLLSGALLSRSDAITWNLSPEQDRVRYTLRIWRADDGSPEEHSLGEKTSIRLDGLIPDFSMDRVWIEIEARAHGGSVSTERTLYYIVPSSTDTGSPSGP